MSFNFHLKVVLCALVAAVYAEAEAEADPALLYAGAGLYSPFAYGIPFKSAPCVNNANVPVPCNGGAYAAYPYAYGAYAAYPYAYSGESLGSIFKHLELVSDQCLFLHRSLLWPQEEGSRG